MLNSPPVAAFQILSFAPTVLYVVSDQLGAIGDYQ